MDVSLLLANSEALLRACALDVEAEAFSQGLEAALAERGLNAHTRGRNRFEQLQIEVEVLNICYDLLQSTCSNHLEHSVAPMQQALWGQTVDVMREQRQQLDSLSGRYQGLRQEHQVLLSNLRSLKLTVQQLLSDVSTLLQHTASVRQQQQAQTQQQQHTATNSWAKQPDFQRHLQRAGFITQHDPCSGSNAPTATHRGVNGSRRCVSADGSAQASPAGGAEADSHASLVALTIQRLIASIERMSRHFADCQAGKLIEDYSSSAPTPAPKAGAASAASTAAVGCRFSVTVSNESSPAVAQTASLGSARMKCSSATACGAGEGGEGASLDIIRGASRARSSSSNGSAVGHRQQGPHNNTMRQVLRLPSSGSSTGGGSGRPGMRNPVLGGIAAAAAAITSAMANASVPKAASTRPGAHRHLPSSTMSPQQVSNQQSMGMAEQQQCQHQQGVLQVAGPQFVDRDDAMRHSLESEQAKAAADAWFAAKAKSSSTKPGTATPADHNKDQMPAGAGAVGDVAAADMHNSSSQQAAGSSMRQQAGAVCGGFSGCSSSTRQVRVAAGASSASHGQQQQAASSAACVLPTGAGDTPGADVTSMAREASSGSSISNQSSLGPSISEVWLASREHSEQATNGAAAAAIADATAVPVAAPRAGLTQSAAAGSRYSQQQSQPGGGSPAKLPPQDPSTRRASRPRTAASAAAAAAVAAAAPGSAASAASSGGSGSVWGPGCSQLKQAGHQHGGALTSTPAAASGPLTAALHSSAARRQANIASNGSDRSLPASVGALSPRRSGHEQGVQKPGPERGGWATAGSSRSASSCSYRSAGSSGYSSGYSSSTRSNSCIPHRPRAGSAGGGTDGSEALLAGAKAPAGYTSSNSSSPTSDTVLTGSCASSAVNSPAAKSAGSRPGSPASAAAPIYGRGKGSVGCKEAPHRNVQATNGSGQPQEQQHVGKSGVSDGNTAARSLDWSSPMQGYQAAVQAGCMLRSQEAGRPVTAQLPPRAPPGPHHQAPQPVNNTGMQRNSSADAQGQQHQGGAAAAAEQQQMQLQMAAKQQQLQVQPVVPCALDSRVHVRLLSPIIEEPSCHTTPRTSATDADAEWSVRRGAFSAGGGKAQGLGCVAFRLCISDDGTAASAGPPARNSSQLSGAAATAAAEQVQQGMGVISEAPDALKQAEGRGGTPKLIRAGSISPADTAVGKDTAAPAPNSSNTWRGQQGLGKQQLGHTDTHQGRTIEEAHFEVFSEPDASTRGAPVRASDRDSPELTEQHAAAAAAAQAWASKAAKQAQWQRRSWDGDNSSSARLLSAFPLDLGPLSHSLDSLDTLLMAEGNTSGCMSDEERCASLPEPVVKGRLTLVAAGEGDEGVDGDSVPVLCGPVRAAGCIFDLQDLLAIVLDVMNDKQAADKRYMSSGLPQPTLGAHLQCYVAAKVHSDQGAYSSAMSAILTGLEQHKQVQPEIAVFCRVLSDELDEEYFHQRHLRLRQQLQYLATQAALSSAVHPQEQKQQQSDLWEDCCTIPLQQQKLQGMLQGWAAERANVLQLRQGWPLQAQQLQELAATWEVDIRQHCGSGPGQSVRAGSAVAALLLWELDQQLQHLRPIAVAFRAADVRCQGVLNLAQFQAFCRCLNPAMSNEEVQVLFTQELRKQGHEQVTFSAICRALLPAMLPMPSGVDCVPRSTAEMCRNNVA